MVVLHVALSLLVLVACTTRLDDPELNTDPDRIDIRAEFTRVANAPARLSASQSDVQVCLLFERAMTKVPDAKIPFGWSLQRFYASALPDLRTAESIATKNHQAVDAELRLALSYLLDGIEYDDEAMTTNIPRVEKRCKLLGQPVS